MSKGYTINKLGTITNTARSTLISWIALGRVNAPTVKYEGIQALRYDDVGLGIAVEQIKKCKPLSIRISPSGVRYTLSCTPTIVNHNK